MGLLIDSTLLIHAERTALTPEQLVAAVLDKWGDVELAVSAMSAGELFHGCWRADTAARRARREEFVETLLSAIPVVPLGLPIMRIFGEIDARLLEVWSKHPCRIVIETDADFILKAQRAMAAVRRLLPPACRTSDIRFNRL